jgi:hypothetical protein
MLDFFITQMVSDALSGNKNWLCEPTLAAIHACTLRETITPVTLSKIFFVCESMQNDEPA